MLRFPFFVVANIICHPTFRLPNRHALSNNHVYGNNTALGDTSQRYRLFARFRVGHNLKPLDIFPVHQMALRPGLRCRSVCLIPSPFGTIALRARLPFAPSARCRTPTLLVRDWLRLDGSSPIVWSATVLPPVFGQ